jgi:hypothetical protein
MAGFHPRGFPLVSRGRRVAVPPSSPVEVLPSIQVVGPAFEDAQLVY